MSDIDKILEILYSLKKDILFTQELILTDRSFSSGQGNYVKNALISLKKDKEKIEISYALIKEKCPDEDYIININKLGNIL